MDDRLAREAADAVRWALDARLSTPRWNEVATLLDDIEAAVRDGDVDTLRDAILDLDDLRTKQQEGRPDEGGKDGEKGPAPATVREQGERIVHTVLPEPPADPKAGGAKGR
jgi:hypothetical protein